MTHVSVFTAIAKDSLPQMTTPQRSYGSVRYFPDHAPIGIHPDGRWIVVCVPYKAPMYEYPSWVVPGGSVLLPGYLGKTTIDEGSSRCTAEEWLYIEVWDES